MEEKQSILESRNNWHGKKILIVEDDETSVFLFKEYFCDTYVQLLHTPYGLEAIELCGHHNSDIDLVIMDLRLPDISGLKATIAIKTFSKIPIVACTAIDTVEDKQACLKAGFDGYIPKPVDFVSAAEIINSLLFKEFHI